MKGGALRGSRTEGGAGWPAKECWLDGGVVEFRLVGAGEIEGLTAIRQNGAVTVRSCRGRNFGCNRNLKRGIRISKCILQVLEERRDQVGFLGGVRGRSESGRWTER